MPLSLPSPFARWRTETAAGAGAWNIAAETPVEIGLNGRPIAVMMATPADLEDFALGFAYTEDVLCAPESVTEIAVAAFPEGVTVDLRLPAAAINADRIRTRTLEGRTGCGLCGIESLADLARGPAGTIRSQSFDLTSVAHAMDAMRDHQALNRLTRTVHAAAWCAAGGTIQCLREDVGRHNALDKLIGALLRDGKAFSPQSGFVIMSSRCSFELVQKAGRLGAGLLATVSAPTTAALELARHLGVQIVSKGPDGLVRFDREAEDES